MSTPTEAVRPPTSPQQLQAPCPLTLMLPILPHALTLISPLTAMFQATVKTPPM